MDVQILNEIAALARKAPPPQVGAPVSGNAQLKPLKGSPVPPPGNPAPPPFEAPPESGQGPVPPDISSVARAASAYSAAVNNGLNSDEINAIQNLAGQIRPAIADFLNQPGLEQAENAEAVVAAHPEAVQDLQAGLEQAVAETFSTPVLVDDGIVPPELPHEQTPAPVAPAGIPISVERVTNGAEPSSAVPVIAASPALRNAQAHNATVRNPANVEEAPATASGDFTGIAASPALVISPADENASIDNSVTVEGVPETSEGDFTVIAASPALQHARGGTNIETPVSRSEPAAPQPTPQSQPETRATTQQDTPVTPPATHGLRELVSDSASATVNPENVRDVNALVNSVVESEFTAEAKKIFSPPKVIRTVADLADFILERLREIILTNQLEKQSSSIGES